MRFIMIAGALALAAACTQPASQSADAGCAVSVSTPWRPLSGTEFTVEAATMGADCAKAVATIVIRDVQGNALWAQAYSTEHVMLLAPAHDPTTMRTALAEWIDPAGNTTLQTTGGLPEWPANADGPQNGEFPFYPDESVDRESYNAIRTGDTPMYCYVQGMESLACIALRDGGMQQVGVQLFPG
jgi:hypothetical protein